MQGRGKWAVGVCILLVLLALGGLLGCTKAKPLPRETVPGATQTTTEALTEVAEGTPVPLLTPSPAKSSTAAEPTKEETPQAKRTTSPTPAAVVTYVVRAGDTAFGIARRFGIDITALVTANDLADPSKLAVGQQLMIPAPSASPTVTASPPAGRTYTVKPGDTLQAIAIRYDTTIEAIASANNIAAPYLIYAGQVLVIP